ncbi:MAG: outer membrane lipoprotein-sorting protein [Fimbriimonadales bacterium]|nr:outer membrane lipoprotein-sorting protein [Fimbriimonadales bacterium]
MKTIFRALPAIVLALASAMALAQSPAQPTLTAEQVLDKSVEASGGKQNLTKLKTAILRATMEAPAQGLQGSVVTYIKAPNKIRVETDIAGIGKTLQGFDGKVAWSKDPIQGLRRLEGAEKAAMVRTSSVVSTDWRQFYTKATYIGTDKVGDRSVHVVEVTPKDAKPVRQFFDAETFLLLKQTGVQQGPMGEMPFEAFFTDYKEFEGLKIPMKQIVKVGPIEIQILMKEIKSGVPVEDKLFAMPAN